MHIVGRLRMSFPCFFSGSRIENTFIIYTPIYLWRKKNVALEHMDLGSVIYNEVLFLGHRLGNAVIWPKSRLIRFFPLINYLY